MLTINSAQEGIENYSWLKKEIPTSMLKPYKDITKDATLEILPSLVDRLRDTIKMIETIA